MPAEATTNNKPFVRVYADAGASASGSGSGVAQGKSPLAGLQPGSTHTFSFDIRASFGSQAVPDPSTPEDADPNHRKSFRTDLRG